MNTGPVSTNTSTSAVVPTTTQNTEPSALDSILESMKDKGFSDSDISLVRQTQAANDLEPDLLVSLDKISLNALQYSGQTAEGIESLLHVPVSMTLIRAIGDPKNWEDGKYIGFGTQVVEDFLTKNKEEFGKETIDSIVLATLIARAKLLQGQVEDKINDIKAMNKEIEDINIMIGKANSLKKIAADKDEATEMPQDMIDFFKKYDAKIHGTDNLHESEGWDINIRNLKNISEKLTSDSQVATTELQQAINKYNQAFELATSFTKKYESTATTVAKG